MPDAALEVAPGRAEAVVGEQLLEQEIERAAIGVALGQVLGARAPERVDFAERLLAKPKE